ncbi:ATP-binding protein [Salinibacterium sp. ZJ77]|uniref:ATP-binding protein n=1 Tax=Salinibacterium sp. ZJ77 TaxID=2708337 RepID=UPI001423E846|nr:ATP-binding protein [Salinibacterium sp. ZJ77]
MTSRAMPPFAVRRTPLVRPRAVALAGVSVALARHLRMPTVGVRWIFAGSALFAGLAAFATTMYPVMGVLVALAVAPSLLYAWLWVFVPREEGTSDAPRARRLPVASLLLVAAAVCALALVFTTTWPMQMPPGAIEAAVLASLAIGWTVAVDARDHTRAANAPRVRALAAGLMILLGAALLPFSISAGRPVIAVFSVVVVLLGALAFVVPFVIDRINARSAERATHARDEQRAEIAAHLHDSVLQTLAIIQNRAGAGSEVARIARAQERELRDWLFAGTDPFAGDLATELRTMAAELELEYAVRIEVVTVGDVAAVESAALAGAAREALVNAARHAGGDVTVYAEARPDAVELFIRDRGAGFDPDAVPDGRLGIRESIVGRMTRAGGAASVASSAAGTEVQLRLPRRAVGNGAIS